MSNIVRLIMFLFPKRIYSRVDKMRSYSQSDLSPLRQKTPYKFRHYSTTLEQYIKPFEYTRRIFLRRASRARKSARLANKQYTAHVSANRH